MAKRASLAILVFFCGCISTYAQGPCSKQSAKLGCALTEEYGSGAAFDNVLFPVGGHPFHFVSDFSATLRPLVTDIGRQANLLPLASPSSGVVLLYDPSLKTFVTGTDSLGPILGERAETIGRHRLFVGFSYQFFDFDKLDGINLQDFPAILTHTDDSRDNSTPAQMVTCSINTTKNLNGCGFV